MEWHTFVVKSLFGIAVAFGVLFIAGCSKIPGRCYSAAIQQEALTGEKYNCASEREEIEDCTQPKSKNEMQVKRQHKLQYGGSGRQKLDQRNAVVRSYISRIR